MKKIVPILLFIIALSLNGQPYVHDVYNNYHTDNYHQWIGVSSKRLDQGMTYIVDLDALFWRYVFAQWVSDTTAADSIVDIVNTELGTSYDWNDIPFFPNAYTYYRNIIDTVVIETVAEISTDSFATLDTLQYYYMITIIDDSLSDIRDAITAAIALHANYTTITTFLDSLSDIRGDMYLSSDAATQINDSLTNHDYYEGSVINDSIISKIAQNNDTASISGGGEVDTSGTPTVNGIATFITSTKIGTNSDFLFTGDTRTAKAFYVGTSTPTGTDTMKWNGRFFARDLTAVNNFYNPGTSTINTLAVSVDATVNGHTKLGNAAADSTYITGDLHVDGKNVLGDGSTDTTTIQMLEVLQNSTFAGDVDLGDASTDSLRLNGIIKHNDSIVTHVMPDTLVNTDYVRTHISSDAITGTISANQIAVGSGTNTIQGEDSLLWQNGGLEITGKLTMSDGYFYIGDESAGNMEWIDDSNYDGYALKFEDEGDSTCMGHDFDDFKFISTGKYSFKTDNKFSITTLSDDSLLRINEPETKIFNNLTVDGDIEINSDDTIKIGNNKIYDNGDNDIVIKNSVVPNTYIELGDDAGGIILNTSGSIELDGTVDIGARAAGTITDNDATPNVCCNDIYTYNGTSNSVTITDLDLPVVGKIYRIIGNSDTYTISINDAGNFNLAGNWTGGADDVITIYVQADNDYIELSRSDN